MTHTLAFVCEKETVPLFPGGKYIYEKGSSCGPFAHVPFLILQLYQSLSSILEFFPISCSGPGTESSLCQPRAYIDKSEHRILTFSTTMSVPNQPMQPAYIQKNGHSHGNKWTHGLFDCFSPFDTCKLPAPLRSCDHFWRTPIRLCTPAT